MATAEQEQVIRSITRWCLGHPVIAEAWQAAYFARMDAGELPSDLLDALIVQAKAVLDPTPAKKNLLAYLGGQQLRAIEGDGSSRDALIRALRAHSGDVGMPCGYDFNETILAGPLDGDVHDYVCPRCGVKGTYRAPLFTE